ncbi:MAG TPA: discoidin domain-containing protein [Sphingobacterium sp.]|jgi:hypothetical protein|nr:discoidin domain-containing protein [Sphingobacterium sp.]
MKTLNFFQVFILLIVLSSWGCEKSTINNHEEEEELPEGITNAWADNPYKLNVVYFVPNDHDSVPDFRERISRILLDGQLYFADNLEREGFGRKSFGLDLISDTLVNIVKIIGDKGKSSYPYSGGGSAVQPEVEAYFTANPGLKKSEHYLVILPSTSGDPMNPGGVPFYGQGRFCYALDYDHMDAQYLGQSGALGDLATKWIGGLLHELGHGLNCPHNYGTISATAEHGVALMGSGNHTYGKGPTFITQTSAAIFASGQTFSTETRSDWYENFTFSLGTLNSTFENGNITLTGEFTSEMNINYVAAYFDPAPYGGNQDYDAITFGTAALNDNAFQLICPLSDFQKLEGVYQLRIHFLGANGTRKTESFVFSFENDEPNLEDVFKVPFNDRSAWSITASNEESGLASRLLDGDVTTEWQPQWRASGPNHPHHFIVDMQASIDFNTLMMYQRSNPDGNLKTFTFSTSVNGTNWTEIGTYTLPQRTGPIQVPLETTVSTRYVKVETVDSYGGVRFTNLAEFDVYLRE